MNDHEHLIQTLLDHAVDLPLHRRIRVYRALAEVVGKEAERVKLLEMAGQLKNADSLCRDFNFSFQQATTANNGNLEA